MKWSVKKGKESSELVEQRDGSKSSYRAWKGQLK